jgi:hypothetical protein
MNRYQITIKADAGHERANGKPDPIAASRGRVFFSYAESVGHAIDKFCQDKIPARDMLPAARVYPHDIEIVEAPFEGLKTTFEENWTKSRPG